MHRSRPTRPSSSHGPSPPLRALRRLLVLATLCGAAVLPACEGNSPVEAPSLSPEDFPEVAAAKREKDADPRTLSIADLLGDPLFQLLVHGIEPESLAEPLLGAVDALASERTGAAMSLIAKASAEAQALEDDPGAAEALIYWSVIERYFEEAELM